MNHGRKERSLTTEIAMHMTMHRVHLEEEDDEVEECEREVGSFSGYEGKEHQVMLKEGSGQADTHHTMHPSCSFQCSRHSACQAEQNSKEHYPVLKALFLNLEHTQCSYQHHCLLIVNFKQ